MIKNQKLVIKIIGFLTAIIWLIIKLLEKF
jgi:hypothetical protein